MNKLVIGIATIFLVSILLVGIFYFQPEMFNPRENSILSVSNISIAPQGSENQATHEWTNGFWTILFTADVNEQYGMLKFSDQDLTSSNDKVNGKTLDVKSTITVKFIPKQPYWEKPLDVQSVRVYPYTKTASASGISDFNRGTPTVGELDVPVAKWGSQYWTAHTPFDVIVYKNGKQIIEQTIDAVGTSQTYILRNPNDNSEWLSIKDIGKLGTGFSAPTIGDIAILAPDVIFRDLQSVINYLNYYGNSDLKFANYWFGGGNYYTLNGKRVETADDGSPGLYTRQTTPIIPIPYNQPLPSNNPFPGVCTHYEGTKLFATPLGAKIFQDQPKGTTTANGVFQKDGLSVVNYLKNVRGLQMFSTNDMNVWQQGWEITAPMTGSQGYHNYVKVNMPYGAMSSLGIIQISTELADAIVYQPFVANIQITGMSWVATGGQIGDSDLLKIDLKQDGSMASTATLTTVATGGTSIFINPANQKVTLDPGQTTSVILSVLNTGAASLEDFGLTATITNELGEVTSTKSITGSMLPKGYGGGSFLTVIAKDKNSTLLLSGIQVAVAWGTESKTRSTSAGTFTLDMEGYQGAATLTSVETTKYKSATVHKDISLGPNTAIMEIEPQGYVSPPDGNLWLYLAIGAVVAVVIVVVAYVAKKKKPRRRR